MTGEHRGRVQGVECSAGFALVLVEQSRDDLDDLLLLTSGERGGLLERLLEPADGPRLARARRFRQLGLGAEEIFDPNAERLGERAENFGAGRLAAPLPKGDVGLRHADDASELHLAERGLFAQREQTSSLSRPGLG